MLRAILRVPVACCSLSHPVTCGVALLAVALSAAAIEPLSALAQDSNAFAFEGHVFDRQTLRPIEGAFVELTETFDNGGRRGLQNITDSSGFYSIEGAQWVAPPNPTAHAIFATCYTKNGGRIDVGGLTYFNLRTEVYRRDFYVALPKGQTRCYSSTGQ